MAGATMDGEAPGKSGASLSVAKMEVEHQQQALRYD
jgi:hypothetical protein